MTFNGNNNSEHNKFSYQNLASQSLQFPIQLRWMRVEETKEYHLKKLLDLSLRSIGEIPLIEKPTYEQKEWFLFRLSNSNSWTKVHENKIGEPKNWK